MTIDYAGIVTDLTTAMGPAVTAAVGFGALVLAAVLGWKLFKRLGK